MQFKLSTETLETVKSDLVVVLCEQKTKDKDDKGTAVLQKSDGGIGLDRHLDGMLSKIIKDESFRADIASTKLVHSNGKIPARAVLMIGTGKSAEFTLDVLRKIGAKISTTANGIKAKSIAGIIQPESVKGFKPKDRIQALVEGFILGAYKFEQYKDKKDTDTDTFASAFFITKGKQTGEIEAAIHKAKILSESVNFIRDLVNVPAKDLTPKDLAKKAEGIAREGKMSCRVWGRKEITSAKMGLLLAVAKGADNEPRFVHMHYKPSGKPRARVALVGKGVTFDSGGYNLKPGQHMSTMKCDMAGAATCIGIMGVLNKLKAAVEVDTYIPITDNMIDAKAEVPGNIIRARNGKTVEIVNTDAEGRLILADALAYAVEKKPDFIIDLATLTGGVLYALGEIYTAVIGNNQKLIDKLLASAKDADEPMWQLPLVKEYKQGFKDGPADLKNLAKTRADTIAGALFLEEFVGETKWVHMDIAESAWSDDARPYTPQGGTGATLRTLVKFLMSL